jgi:hypothetical protein
MFVPLKAVSVTPGVTTVISLHAVDDPEPPPHPANEKTGLVTDLENESVNIPRDGHKASAAHPELLV